MTRGRGYCHKTPGQLDALRYQERKELSLKFVDNRSIYN